MERIRRIYGEFITKIYEFISNNWSELNMLCWWNHQFVKICQEQLTEKQKRVPNFHEFFHLSKWVFCWFVGIGVFFCKNYQLFKGPFIYYVITFLGFLDLPPPLRQHVFSTKNKQKLAFSDTPSPPTSADVIYEWSLWYSHLYI